MRASVTSLTKKFISTFFAATLVMGLIPAAAFAVEDNGEASPKSEESANADSLNTEDRDSQLVISSEVEKSAPIEQNEAEGLTTSSEEEETVDEETGSDSSNLSIPAALERINEDVALTQPVAQQESTRSYFLAQTLESTKTVPIVSANLPLDKGASSDVVEPDAEGEGNDSTEDEGGEDSDESDPGVISTEASDSERSGEISAASTVIGSFEYNGIVYAIEPGGETVAVVASDYAKLLETSIEKNTIVLPSTVTADYIDYYSVTRIGDYAFASLTSEVAATRVISTEASESERSGEISPEEESDETVGITILGIPSSITSIDDNAFSGFTTLQYIVVEEVNPSYASYDGALYSADLTNLRLIPEGRVGTIRVAPSATTVDPEAFSHCPSVDTVVADPESEVYESLSRDETLIIREESLPVDDALPQLAPLVFYSNQGITDIGIDGEISTSPFEILERSTLAAIGGIIDANGGTLWSARMGQQYYSINHTALIERWVISDDRYKIYGTDIRGTTTYETITLNPRAGYVLSGWTKTPVYGTAPPSFETTGAIAADGSHWYALWQVPFAFDANKGTWNANAVGDPTNISGSTYTSYRWSGASDGNDQFNFGSAVSRAGYILKGWNTTSSATTVLTNYSYPNTSTTYYAVWDAKTSALAFNLQGGAWKNGETLKSPITASYDSAMPGIHKSGTTTKMTVPTKTGYTFAGFYDAASGGNMYYKANLDSHRTWNKDITSATTLYAHWTGDSISITWDANWGGWGNLTTSTEGQTCGNNLTLPSDPTRTGYTFAGWYTLASGGTQVTASTTVPTGATTYYAHWTGNPISITWNANNGKWSDNTTTKSGNQTCGNSLTLWATNPSRTGYAFAGWYTSASGGTQVTASTTVPTGATTYYAHWTGDSISITWNANGGKWNGTLTTSTGGQTCGSSLTLPSDPSRDGYTFAGWYTAASGGTQVTASTTVPTGATTYYAHWTGDSISITWNANGGKWNGTLTTSTGGQTCGSSLTLPSDPSRDGYTFAGWYTAASGGTQVTTSTTVPTGTTTYYAHWTGISYTLKFSANGGSGTPPADHAMTYGTAYTIPNCTLTKTGYTFDGWATTAGGAKAYEKTASVNNLTTTANSTVTLYAHWTGNSISITWNANGGKWSGNTTTKSENQTCGNSLTLWATNPTRDGYTFAGWYTAASGGTQVTTSTTVPTGATTYYAHWTGNSISITWNANGGKWSDNTTTKSGNQTCGNSLSLYSTNPSREGYTFAGWYTSASGGTQVTTSTTVPTGTTTYYAHWTGISYTLKFSANGGSGTPPADHAMTYGTAYTIPSCTLTKTGYEFDGWATTAGGAKAYEKTASVSNLTTTSGATVTLYAHWNPYSYTLKFNVNGGTGIVPGDKVMTYGTAYPIPSCTLSKAGYTHDGWATSATGAKVYEKTASVNNLTSTKNGEVILYAHWNPISYTLAFNVNGGTGSVPADHAMTYDTAYTIPSCAPTRNGYEFDGWATSANGAKAYEKTASVSNLTTTANATVTLYAHWKLGIYTISWNMMGHGEDQKPTKTSYTFGETVELPPINDVEGWDFKGWYEDSGYASAALDITATTYGNKSIYAKWDRAQYKIKYEMNGHGTEPTSPTGWTYGTPPKLVDPAKVEGWTFGGWYTDKDCTDGKQANITVSSSSDITLYAKWTVNKHTVNWKYGGADGKTDYPENDVAYGTDVYMIDPGKKAGWKFAGWQASGANTSSYGYGNNEYMVMPDGDVTLTAQWTKLDRIAVNLADKHLDEATGKLWYWPEQGYLTEENSPFPVAVGSVIVTPPGVSGYEFLGWYATEDQNDNDDPMIDGQGILRTSSVPGTVTTWYAHWKWVSCPVNLLAEYDDIPYVTSAGDPTSIPFARFGVALNECLEGGKLKALPERTGYTFMGYYTKANPEVSTTEAEDPANFEGTQWIDCNGNLSTDKWNEYPTDKRGSITLYAAWMLDDCKVVFDAEGQLAPNTERVVVAEGTKALDDIVWNYGKPKGNLPVAGADSFYRNGYTFAGWYYLEGTEKVFVSDAQGNPTPENWLIVKKSVTLYPAWTAKKYKLVFDDNYPKIEGLEAPEKTEKSVEVYYDQELDLSQFTPKFFPYTFAGWYTRTNQLFEGTHMTDNSNGTKRFTPRGAYAPMSQIELIAHWNKMDQATYTLFWKIPGESEIKQSVHDYGFTDTVQFNGTAAPAAPAGSGYRFEGWVEMDSYKEATDALASDRPYMEGDTVSGWKPISNWDRYFVAKWTERAFSVSFSTTPHEATSNGESWLMPTDALENWKGENGETGDALSWEEACALANQKDFTMATGIFYNIDMPSFVLPDVKRKGQVFEGWKLLDAEGNPTGAAERGIIVEPSKQDVQGMRDLVYVPVFKDALYTIVLDANVYGEEQRFEDVPYSGEFTFPYPATLSTGSVFVCWGEDTNTNSDGTEKFYPMQSVKLAPTYNELGEMTAFGLAHLANDKNEITLYAVWNNATYNVEVPLFANLAIDTERGDVIAGVNTIAPDPDNEDQTAVYRIESVRYEPLKNDKGVYAFQREGTPSDKIYLSVYAGLDTGDTTDTEHLLYAENIGDDGEVTYTDAKGETATAKPLLIELGGTTPVVYGRTAPEGQTSLESVTGKTGFVTFSQSNPLTIRYGLFFQNEQTRKDFAFNGKYAWLLPEADVANKRTEPVDTTSEDYGRRVAWSGNTVDVAKLHYTVSLVGDTK